MTHQLYQRLLRFCVGRPRSGRTGRRRNRTLVVPEQLESRNAPGVMLPILPQLDPLSDEISGYAEVADHASLDHATDQSGSEPGSESDEPISAELRRKVGDKTFADLGAPENSEFLVMDDLALARAQTIHRQQLPASNGLHGTQAISDSETSNQMAYRIGMLLGSLLGESVANSQPIEEPQHEVERPLYRPSRHESTSGDSGSGSIARATGTGGGGSGGDAPGAIPSQSAVQSTSPAPIAQQNSFAPASAAPDENVQEAEDRASRSVHAEAASPLIAAPVEPVVENHDLENVADSNPVGPPEPSNSTAQNADFDLDGDIDGTDFLTWQRNVGMGGQVNNSNGDADGNGSVGSTDLTAWESQYGQDDVSISPTAIGDVLKAAEVKKLLERASAATASENAIIAVVDRQGSILGVRVEDGVPIDPMADADTLVFAIDGAVAKARTAAYFSNDQAALTSRTVRFISQSTITQREVQANPNSSDQEIRGPGFVAPIGLGGHFPPDVFNTPHVDLFAIEHTNRDSVINPGPDRVRQSAMVDGSGTVTSTSGDDILLGTRFGAVFEAGQAVNAPESYGLVSGELTRAQSRGIATLPGGIPIFRNVDNSDPSDDELIGGIGVFFPGTKGYADFEQAFAPGVGQTTAQRLNAPLVLEAEYIAAAAVGLVGGTIDGVAPLAEIGVPPGRIDLVGITLESIGPHPYGIQTVIQRGADVGPGVVNGTDRPVIADGTLYLSGEDVPSGWLVMPTASAELTASEVEKIILDGVEEAKLVRSAIRLPLGSRSRMVLSVTDKDGTVLGLFRMDDSTFFSIDVAVAKARNVAYYADSTPGTGIESIDLVDGDGDGIADLDPGVAFTNRTFRFVSEARFPSGIEQTEPGPFSTLFTTGVNRTNAENNVGVTPLAADFDTVLGFDAFNPASNFHEAVPATGFQNGVVFFPGSTPLYRNGTLVGGFGVSGDGVDQDDVVTFVGAGSFLPRKDSSVTRADEVFVRDVRLPYQKFLRNPHG